MLLLPVRQLQKDSEWAKWVDLAFAKLDTNDDGYIDLEELIAQLPGMGVGIDERRDSERLLAVSAQAQVCPASQIGESGQCGFKGFAGVQVLNLLSQGDH